MSLQYARKRSRIVIVGAVKMQFPRSPFYEKELEVRQSCSYGAGRYDSNYEEKGNDYPIGYVRWTENRNMEAVLDLISLGKLDVRSLITHRISIEEALTAYDIVTAKKKEKHLAILINYRAQIPPYSVREDEGRGPAEQSRTGLPAVVGLIGAGNFAQSYLIPPLQKIGTRLRGVTTSRPVSALSVKKKFNFEFCTTNAAELLDDPQIDTVFVATRHDSHARYVIEALSKGKHVFVEKPLAVNIDQLREIYKVATRSTRLLLMVGFNRRFSRAFLDMKSFFSGRREPFVLNYRINAGFIPKSHWYQDEANGGRIIGEVCHFVDALQFFTDSRPKSVFAACVNSLNSQVTNEDNVNITIKFADGSIGTISYVANGDNRVGKEYLEIFCENSVVRFDNFRRVEFTRGGKTKSRNYDGDKGHSGEVKAFTESVKDGGGSPLKLESLVYTTLTTLRALDSIRNDREVSIDLPF
jgi:polar amino acid transport system substrate-binding protein